MFSRTKGKGKDKGKDQGKGQAATIWTKACPALHNDSRCTDGPNCGHDHSRKTFDRLNEAVSKQYEAQVEYWPIKNDGRCAPTCSIRMKYGLADPNTPIDNIEWPPWRDFAENIDRTEHYESEAEYSDTQTAFEEEHFGVAVPVHPVTHADFGYSDEEYQNIGGDFPFAEETEE